MAAATVYTFPYDEPPKALTDTVMAVVEGETDVRLTFGGDCTLGGEASGSAKRFARFIAAEGYAYPFANLRPLFAADDLTLVNLEGVLSERDLPRVRKQYNFKGATGYTAILTEGSVECVSLANNHALDYGAAGKRDTVAALTAAGLAFVDDTYVTVLEKDGVRVGFTGSGLQLNRDRFLAQAKALRDLGCGALVHVMHTGVEYADAPTAGQIATARFLSENGVALVVGHHPHVAQGLATFGRTLVAYSLGNCVFGGNTDPRDYDAYVLGATLRFTDGIAERLDATAWPIRVSGAKRNNDYQPMLLTGKEAERVFRKILASSGANAAPITMGDGALQAGLDLR